MRQLLLWDGHTRWSFVLRWACWVIFFCEMDMLGDILWWDKTCLAIFYGGMDILGDLLWWAKTCLVIFYGEMDILGDLLWWDGHAGWSFMVGWTCWVIFYGRREMPGDIFYHYLQKCTRHILRFLNCLQPEKCRTAWCDHWLMWEQLQVYSCKFKQYTYFFKTIIINHSWN